MMYKADREWHCSVCGKSGVGKTDISRHIEGTHITNHPGLQCHICGEKLKSRNALRLHKSSKHKSFFVMWSAYTVKKIKLILQNTIFNKYKLDWEKPKNTYLDIFAALDEQISSMMTKVENVWRCNVCGKTFKTYSEMSRHIEGAHIENHPGITCDICGELKKNRNALRQHKATKHRYY